MLAKEKGDVFLVSCVAEKRPVPAAARGLYLSPWFRKARAFAESGGTAWFILSAEHGLLEPDMVVAPYERTLNRMAIAARRAWAVRVLGQIQERVPRSRRLVLLAGQRYREFLEEPLRARYAMDVPLRGMRIGEQLHWLSERAP